MVGYVSELRVNCYSGIKCEIMDVVEGYVRVVVEIT